MLRLLVEANGRLFVLGVTISRGRVHYKTLVSFPKSINAIFMEFTHFWRSNELSADRSDL